MLLSLFFIFLLGTSLGSFLNCVIYRLEVGKKPTGRSFCPKCKHTLSHKDLVPLISYVFLKGKCRYCDKKISAEYPLVEFATGVLFAVVFYLSFPVDLATVTYLNVLTTVYLLIVSLFLVLIFVYDLKHFIIPDFANFTLIGLSLFYLSLMSAITGDVNLFISGVLSAAAVFLFFFSLFYFTKGKGMGFGDVKFVIFMGFFLGFPNIIVANFIAFFLGAVIGLLLVAKNKKGMKSEVPFGPFLIIGTVIAYFFGEQIVGAYLMFL